MATVTFTPEEQQMIANAINYGLFNTPGSWEAFQERLRNDWRRYGVVERALNDASYGVGRELRGIARAFSDPGIGVKAAGEHFQRHGIIGGVGEVAKSVVTSPFRAAGTVVAEGGGLGDRPLQTLTGLAAFVPVGRLGTALAGAGARAAGRTTLASTLGRAAGSRGFTHAARGAEALDVFTGIEEWPLELGADVAIDLGTSGLARSLQGRPDLSADGPPPDVPPEIPSQTTPPPTPPRTPQTTQARPQTPPGSQTTLPGDPSGTILTPPGLKTTLPPSGRPMHLVPLEQEPQTQGAGLGIQFGQQAPKTPQALPGGVVPFVHELWQMSDGSVVMPQTPGSKQTFDNTRKYAYGDPNDESSVGAMTVKRVPNPETGEFDNRHWQVWFSGGAFGEVDVENAILIDKSHGIDSYAGARDAVLSGSHQPGVRDNGRIIASGPTQIPTFKVDINSMWQNHQNNRREREARRELRREERQQQPQEDTTQETPPEQIQPTEQPDSTEQIEETQTQPTEQTTETVPTEESDPTEQFVETQAQSYVEAIEKGTPLRYISQQLNDAVNKMQRELNMTPQEGAQLFQRVVTRANEILPPQVEDEQIEQETTNETDTETPVQEQPDEISETEEEVSEPQQTQETPEEPTEQISEEEQRERVLNAIDAETNVNNIVQDSGLPTKDVLTILFQLELAGQVTRAAGNMYKKTEQAPAQPEDTDDTNTDSTATTQTQTEEPEEDSETETAGTTENEDITPLREEIEGDYVSTPFKPEYLGNLTDEQIDSTRVELEGMGNHYTGYSLLEGDQRIGGIEHISKHTVKFAQDGTTFTGIGLVDESKTKEVPEKVIFYAYDPKRTIDEAQALSTAENVHSFDEHDWGDGEWNAFYPTFNTLEELLAYTNRTDQTQDTPSEETEVETQTPATPEAEPTPEEAARAEVDTERETLPEYEGDQDVIRWQQSDGSWEETPVVYKLIEHRSAVASHKLSDNRVSLERNPAYNWDLGIQGRAEGRYEEIQERARANQFNPNLPLEKTQGMGRGTPTLLNSYDAVGGNHRLILLKLIYLRAGGTAEAYLQALTERLPEFGIDPAVLEQFTEPVLVRQVIGEISDPKAFGEASNTPDAAPRTAEHQAVQDAESLTSDIFDAFSFGETGGSNRKTIAEMLADPTDQNLTAFLEFIDELDQAERSRYRRGNTRKLAPNARHLFENAVLAKTFTSERGKLMFEAKENGTLVPTQNTRALMMMLPHLAKFDALLQLYHPNVQALSISDDVGAALQYLSHLRGEPNNFKIGQAAAHIDSMSPDADPTLTPESIVLMRTFNGIKDTGPIANVVINYVAKAIENIKASGVSVAIQKSLFKGTKEYMGPSKLDMLNEVIEETTKPKKQTQETTQPSLFGDEQQTTEEKSEDVQDEEAIKQQAMLDMGLDPDDMPDDFDPEQDIEDLEYYEELARDRNDEFSDYKRKSPNANWEHAYPKTKTERADVRKEYRQKINTIIQETPTLQRKPLQVTDRQIKMNKYFQLRGRNLRSAAEGAILAQFIRNPLVESTLILLRKSNIVVGAEWFSLGQSDTTTPGSMDEVERLLDETGADDFIRVHNHTSKIAKFSADDKVTTQKWRDRFGNRLAAEVIINEGTYATSQFDKTGDEMWLEEQKLDLQNGLPEAPFIGSFLKTPDGWTTFIMTDDAGNIRSVVEKQGFMDMNRRDILGTLDGYLNAAQATKMHIFVGRGNNTDGMANLHSTIRGKPEFASAWIDGIPLEQKQVLGSDLPQGVQDPVLRDYTTAANRVAPGSYFVPHGTEPGTVNPDKIGFFSRLRSLFDPAASLKAKLDGYTPKMKLNLERTRREYMSGYRNLETMGPVGAEIREIAEHLLRLQEQGTARDLNTLESHRKELIDLAKQRTKGQKGAAREAVYSMISEQVYRFMEENTPIEDAEIAQIATGWKETWRKILKAHDIYMMQLREKVEALGEQLLVYSTSGKEPKPWTPILPGHRWLDDYKMFIRDSDGATLTLEQAIDETSYLYMPHVYPRSHWTELMNQVETGVLDRLLEAERDPDIEEVPGFIIRDTDDGRIYEFTRTGETYDSKQAAIAGARAFWNASYAMAQQQLATKESDLLGRFGSLEIARETHDRLYNRDVMTLLDHTALFWRRFAEISVWGQHDPATGKHPRLQKYLSRLEQTTLDADEHALKVLTDTLLSHEMFEKLPSFVEGETQAYHILRNWKHPVRDPQYWEDKPPPPPDHPVDIERMQRENPEGWTPEVLESLQRIGLIEQKGDAQWTIKGETKAAKDTTFVKIMVPFFETRQLREQTLRKIVQGLGHWDQLEPVDSQSNKFWQLLNSMTTMFTLGFGNAAQNIAEVPWLAAMSGSKPLMIGLQRFSTDTEFRQMLPRFGATLNKARDYLAQGELQNRYMSMIGFTTTEKWSRLMGTAVGWETARDAIQAHIQNPNKNTISRLQELNISPAAVQQYNEALTNNEAPSLDDLVKEAERRVLDGAMMLGGLRPPDTPAPTHPMVDLIGDEMAKSARYVSTRIFKGYNALSMPNFLTKKNPMLRTFFKYKAWSAQMHQFIWEQMRYAAKQAKAGNLKPAMRLAIGAGFMMGSAAVMTSVFNALRGRERDEDRNRILEALAQSQAAGAISTIIEISQISDQNPYRASQMISSFFSAPVIGITSRIAGELFAGKPRAAATEFGLRFPFVREIPRIQQIRGE